MTPPGLENTEIRNALIEYYKWIVNLAVFVLTISVSLIALFGSQLTFAWLFVGGWLLLAFSIFANWLIVKRLVTIPVVAAQPQSAKGGMHRGFESSHSLLRTYGLIQNLCFLLGCAALLVAFALNWLLPG